MSDGWLCLLVNGSFHHGDRKVATHEIASIFGKDLLGLKFAFNDNMVSTGEYYAFVKCQNYANYTERISKSQAIANVIPSVLNPDYISDAEVEAFLKSMNKEVKPPDFVRGDMVMVKEGYLRGLFGVVQDEVKKGKYCVSFSFYMRRFHENLPVTALKFVANVFKRDMKKRIPTAIREHPIAVKHKIHRKKCRKAERRSRR